MARRVAEAEGRLEVAEAGFHAVGAPHFGSFDSSLHPRNRGKFSHSFAADAKKDQKKSLSQRRMEATAAGKDRDQAASMKGDAEKKWPVGSTWRAKNGAHVKVSHHTEGGEVYVNSIPHPAVGSPITHSEMGEMTRTNPGEAEGEAAKPTADAIRKRMALGEDKLSPTQKALVDKAVADHNAANAAGDTTVHSYAINHMREIEAHDAQMTKHPDTGATLKSPGDPNLQVGDSYKLGDEIHQVTSVQKNGYDTKVTHKGGVRVQEAVERAAVASARTALREARDR